MKIQIKNYLKLSLSFVFILSLLLSVTTSCSKDKKKNTQSQFVMPQFPEPEDADNIFVALKVTTSSKFDIPGGVSGVPGMPDDLLDMKIKMGIGVAKLKGNKKADKVLLNDHELKFQNGSHTNDFMVDMTNPDNFGGDNVIGIDNIDDPISWEVTNPTFSKNLAKIPTNSVGTPEITSGRNVSLGSDFTITNKAVSNADKIIYVIAGNGKIKMIEKAGSSTSCTFTSAEIGEIGKSDFVIIEANAYKIYEENSVISGEKTYFINQNSYAQSGGAIK